MMLKEQDNEQEICRAPSPPNTQTTTTITTTSTSVPTADESLYKENESKDSPHDPIGSQRVYKKTSSNQLLTLYLGSREMIARRGVIDPLKGVVYIDPKIMTGFKIYGQITLTFRYGREDEEVMGLKFCNEAVISLKQLWPRAPIDAIKEELTPLQEALLERLGKNAVAFSIDINTLAPPSVQLLPAKRYTGAPIGTSYDIRIFTDIDGVFLAEQTEERIQRRSTVRLGIRLTHKICPDASLLPPDPVQSTPTPRSLRLRLSPKSLKLSKQSYSLDGTSTSNIGRSIVEIERRTTNDLFNKGPQGTVEKPFLWAEGRVYLKATLNKSAYTHGEDVLVTLDVKNDSRKIVRKIRIYAIQHVDVCMFSNGKFKNVVAEIEVEKHIGPNETFHGNYPLLPVRGTTKNWIAVEGALFNTSSSHDTSLIALNSKLASSAHRGPQTSDEKNVFAIYVSYYVKVKLTLSAMGGEVSLKLPFILGNVEFDPNSEENKRKRLTSTSSTSASKSGEQSKEDYMTVKDVSESKNQSSSGIGSHEDIGDCSKTEDDDIITVINEPEKMTAKCKLEKFRDLKLNENLSDSIDAVSEELNNIFRNNCDKNVKLRRSDSSKSNLDYSAEDRTPGLEPNGNNVIQAQVHCEEKHEEQKGPITTVL
uniref:CSON013564 protein n=1 Tax=Culicoides sonorensis TaxID=179676 RepID=A0A336MCB4_CULSO